MVKKHVLAEAGSPSSKAAALLARGAYAQYVSTTKGRERRWRLFSTFPVGFRGRQLLAISFREQLGIVNLSPIWPHQRVELVRRSLTNQWVTSGRIVCSGLNPR